MAAIRGLFDYLVTGGVIPFNSASSVRGPKYRIKCGKTPVLNVEEIRSLFRSIDATKLVGLRDRALISVMMIKRRSKAAGFSTTTSPHSWRGSGITEYLRNGGSLETAQEIAAHESSRTTKLYDRSQGEIMLDEIERIPAVCATLPLRGSQPDKKAAHRAALTRCRETSGPPTASEIAYREGPLP